VIWSLSQFTAVNIKGAMMEYAKGQSVKVKEAGSEHPLRGSVGTISEIALGAAFLTPQGCWFNLVDVEPFEAAEGPGTGAAPAEAPVTEAAEGPGTGAAPAEAPVTEAAEGPGTGAAAPGTAS